MKTPYSQRLKDPLWQKRRLSIFERDNFECRSCGDTRTELHVHHVAYLVGAQPWEYPDHLLITLCSKCHEAEELDRPKVDAELAQAFRSLGATNNMLRLLIECMKDTRLMHKNPGAVIPAIMRGFDGIATRAAGPVRS